MKQAIAVIAIAILVSIYGAVKNSSGRIKQKPIMWCTCSGCYEIPADWICPKCGNPIP